MSDLLFDDNQIINDENAQKLAIHYSAMLGALEKSGFLNKLERNSNINADETQNNQPVQLTTNQLLTAILCELKEIKQTIAWNKKIRLS